jgi:hypothetical protein
MLNKDFLKNSIVFYSIKSNNEYLNPNWKKRMVPITISEPYIYNSKTQAEKEIELVNEMHKDYNFKIVELRAFTTEYLNSIIK